MAETSSGKRNPSKDPLGKRRFHQPLKPLQAAGHNRNPVTADVRHAVLPHQLRQPVRLLVTHMHGNLPKPAPGALPYVRNAQGIEGIHENVSTGPNGSAEFGDGRPRVRQRLHHTQAQDAVETPRLHGQAGDVGVHPGYSELIPSGGLQKRWQRVVNPHHGGPALSQEPAVRPGAASRVQPQAAGRLAAPKTGERTKPNLQSRGGPPPDAGVVIALFGEFFEPPPPTFLKRGPVVLWGFRRHGNCVPRSKSRRRHGPRRRRWSTDPRRPPLPRPPGSSLRSRPPGYCSGSPEFRSTRFRPAA